MTDRYVTADATDAYMEKPFDLKAGQVIVLYTDEGPTGITGQSMSITCPHALFAVFENEEDARKFINSSRRKGRNSDLRLYVVGDYGSGKLMLGDYGSGKLMLGDYGSGKLMLGDYGSGKLMLGDFRNAD